MAKKVFHLRSSGGLLGAENVILELSKNAHRFGYQVIVGALQDVGDPYPEFILEADRLGLATRVFQCKKKIDIATVHEIRRFIKAEHIDVLHCHGYKEDIYGRFSSCGVVCIATNHLWKNTTLKSRCYSFIDAVFLRFFDGVVGVSDDIVSFMKSLGIRGAIKISNGVDTSKFIPSLPNEEMRDALCLPKGSFVLCMVASLTVEKGHYPMILALERIKEAIPDVILLIVGKGRLETELKSSVRAHSLDKYVVFAGAQTDIPSILSLADVFVLASFKEGLPMAMLEAMSAGKAVVATDVGDVATVMDDDNGVLIPSNDPEKIEKAILDLYFDKPKQQRFSGKAREKIKASYSSIRTTEHYCQLYDSMIDPNAPSMTSVVRDGL